MSLIQVLFIICRNRDIKPSLRQLSAQFLGKIIQESKHNPTEDAKASLQLVLLNLANCDLAWTLVMLLLMVV
jgi:hypothetical protein